MPTRNSRCSPFTSVQVPTIAHCTVLLNTREIMHYTETDYFYDSSSLHICPLIPLIPFLILPFITLLTIIFLITFLPLLLFLLHTRPNLSCLFLLSSLDYFLLLFPLLSGFLLHCLLLLLFLPPPLF